MFLKNHCKMYDDSAFFTGVMNSGNHTLLNEYQKAGAKDPSFKVKGVLSISMKDPNLQLL